MQRSKFLRNTIRRTLASSAVAALGATTAVQAQDQEAEFQEIVVTGTRITMPGVVSSSPIYSVGAAEIELQQQPEIEKILRILPITAPDDGQNVNNGTDGAATVNLRGLGPQRNLVLIDGKRLTPYSVDGLVDTSMIPTALIERIDIITGGASAVYGSDAISGALNFIMKKDFEGIEINTDFSQTDEEDGDIKSAAVVMGANVADGRGNVVLALNWSEREPILLGARPLGLLGIGTADGSGYEEFLSGSPPPPAPAGCGGPGSVAAGGSTTTLPTRVSIAGGPALGQFREDGSLQGDCSVFNFNPFNYYQTPQDRFSGMVIGSYELSEHAEPYARFSFGNTTVSGQVAPSGAFAEPFFTPLANPFISAQARGVIIAAAEAGRVAGTVNEADPNDPDVFPNWVDVNGNGVVDEADRLNISYRRRTVEFGPRSEAFDNNGFHILLGTRGAIVGDWDYDVSFQYGESNRTHILAGYTNVTNMANAVDSVDGVTCANGDPTCVPINFFGGFGAITPEMAAYSSATAIERQTYEQTIAAAVATGPISAIKLPTAANSLAVSVGAEYREELGSTTPDECLKLAPSSCLGGAGSNILPIAGGFDVTEFFGEAILPLVDDRPGFKTLNLELGYRISDYEHSGTDETWKVGLNWRPVDQLLLRVMQQQAARAPNVAELSSPITSGLENAKFDPCSIGNPDPISAELRALCITTGMSDAQVGTVEDIVSGQVSTIAGTNLAALPLPEQADTFTAGIVWTPDFGGTILNPVLSVDYYDIDIDEVIGEFTAQEALDGCYLLGIASECAKMERIGGTLTLPGAGIRLLTTNLVNRRVEGLEFGFAFGVEIGRFGGLNFSGTVNKYLTAETQAADFLPVLDCLGFYGTSCQAPRPEIRWVQRTTWDFNDLQVSMLWRHIGSTSVEPVEREGTFEAFRQIDSFDYIDLHAGYQLTETLRLALGISNLFSEDPPVVGNEAGSTTFNSGNTFPAHYETLGRLYTVSLNAKF
jgi:outer membrane receptor protein involved in Fe transport